MSENMPEVVYLKTYSWSPDEEIGGVAYVHQSKYDEAFDRAETAERKLEGLTFHAGSDGKTNTHLAVVLHGSCNDEFIHWIEQALDRPLFGCGFTHTGTTREDGRVVLHYFQFAVSMKDGEG